MWEKWGHLTSAFPGNYWVSPIPEYFTQLLAEMFNNVFTSIEASKYHTEKNTKRSSSKVFPSRLNCKLPPLLHRLDFLPSVMLEIRVTCLFSVWSQAERIHREVSPHRSRSSRHRALRRDQEVADEFPVIVLKNNVVSPLRCFFLQNQQLSLPLPSPDMWQMV